MQENKKIFESMEWALTTAAQEALDRLKAKGMDADLAFTVLDLTWSEDEMYRTMEAEDETA